MAVFGFILIAGFFLDLLIGDPRYRFHPVRLLGLAVSFFVRLLRRCGLGNRTGGVLLVLIVVCSALAAYGATAFVLGLIHPLFELCFNVFVCYSCLALKDLLSHVRPVMSGLEKGDVDKARESLSMVVGRDVALLDEPGMARASVETLTENFVDGFLSPLFWYLAGGCLALILGLSPETGGLGLMLAFKAASTLDSMVGHRSEEFMDLGWASARLDDGMNFIPARLSFVPLFFGALFCGLSPLGGLKTGLRDRLKHDSPNSAHAESFGAGALGVRLGGPLRYVWGIVDKAWVGEGNPDPGPGDIRRSERFLLCSGWIAVIMEAGLIAGLYAWFE